MPQVKLDVLERAMARTGTTGSGVAQPTVQAAGASLEILQVLCRQALAPLGIDPYLRGAQEAHVVAVDRVVSDGREIEHPRFELHPQEGADARQLTRRIARYVFVLDPQQMRRINMTLEKRQRALVQAAATPTTL